MSTFIYLTLYYLSFLDLFTNALPISIPPSKPPILKTPLKHSQTVLLLPIQPQKPPLPPQLQAYLNSNQSAQNAPQQPPQLQPQQPPQQVLLSATISSTHQPSNESNKEGSTPQLGYTEPVYVNNIFVISVSVVVFYVLIISVYALGKSILFHF